MVGQVKSLDGTSGTIFEFSEEATLPFAASEIVGSVSVGDHVTFDVTWSESARSIVNVTKQT